MSGPDPDKPFVLIRKGHPPWRFSSLEQARKMYDSLRFSRAGTDASAAIFGPQGIEWRCDKSREANWVEMTRANP